MPALRRYDQETRDRAVRMYQERRRDVPEESAVQARRRVGERLDVKPETRAVHAVLDRLCDVAPAWVERLEEIGLDEKPTAHLRRTVLARWEELGAD